MPYYDVPVLPQLRPMASVANGQLQLPHLTKCQDRLTVEVSEPSGEVINGRTTPAGSCMIQQLLSSQPGCSGASYNSSVNTARAAQNSNGYLQQTVVSGARIIEYSKLLSTVLMGFEMSTQDI